MKKLNLLLLLIWMVGTAVAQSPATTTKEGDELIKFVSVKTGGYNTENHPQEVEIPFSEFTTPYKIETKGNVIMFSFQSDTIGVAKNHAVKLIKNGWIYRPEDEKQIKRLLEPLWWYQEFIKKPTTTKIFYDEKFN